MVGDHTIHDQGWGWGYLNGNNSVSFGANGFNESSNEMHWQHIIDYVYISMILLQLFYSQQNYTFRGVKSG